jgi:starch phosphorylase
VAQHLAASSAQRSADRSVTNGIHVRTWLSSDIVYTLERYLSEDWKTKPAKQDVWEGVMQIPDEELCAPHERLPERPRRMGAAGAAAISLTKRGASLRRSRERGAVRGSAMRLTIGFAAALRDVQARRAVC